MAFDYLWEGFLTAIDEHFTRIFFSKYYYRAYRKGGLLCIFYIFNLCFWDGCWFFLITSRCTWAPLKEGKRPYSYYRILNLFSKSRALSILFPYSIYFSVWEIYFCSTLLRVLCLSLFYMTFIRSLRSFWVGCSSGSSGLKVVKFFFSMMGNFRFISDYWIEWYRSTAGIPLNSCFLCYGDLFLLRWKRSYFAASCFACLVLFPNINCAAISLFFFSTVS